MALRRPGHVLAAVALAAAGGLQACSVPATLRPPAALPGIMSLPEVAKPAVYRITTRSGLDIDALAKRGMDVFTVRRGTVEGRPSAEALAYAKSQKLSMTTLRGSFDVEQGLPPGYMRYDAIVARLQTIAKEHPDLATVVDLGPSWQTVQGSANRRVWGLRLTSTGKKGPKPKALFTAGQHARELAPPEIAMRFVEELVGKYGQDATITELLNTREAWVVPVVNPDGRVDVEGGNAMWRKNRHRFTRSVGVDLNRNFDSHWTEGDGNPNNETFHGETAFSEPELSGIRDLLAREKFAVSMDYHAYAGAVIWPPGWSRSYTPDQAAYARIGKALTEKNSYDADTIARRFYLAPGSICDWAYEKYGVMGFGTEMGDTFRPPSTQLPKLYGENRDGALYLLKVADNPKGTAGD